METFEQDGTVWGIVYNVGGNVYLCVDMSHPEPRKLYLVERI